jgi:hypothetical protein
MAELKEVDPALVLSLKEKLVAPETDITERYRVLFSLRNVQGDVAREALIECKMGIPEVQISQMGITFSSL